MSGKIALAILMLLVIFGAFYFPAPQNQLGDVSRIFFFHIPVAWVTVLAFFVSLIYSIYYLKKKGLIYDIKASVSARLGLLFAFLATISGAIFAKSSWGSFWNWDPRETSVFILLLIYGAYLALRSAVQPEEKRAALSSVYSILAFVTVPFLIFVVPRVYHTLHPTDSIVSQGRVQMSPLILITFLGSLLGFTLLFFWLWKLEVKILSFEKNRNRLEEV
jgi:heme exporter protein C